MAIDLAARQIEDGSASSQVITHFLKLGSTREQLEQARILEEIELTKGKKDALARSDKMEALMEEALKAFRTYQPDAGGLEEDDYAE
jgi:hypothetical protein